MSFWHVSFEELKPVFVGTGVWRSRLDKKEGQGGPKKICTQQVLNSKTQDLVVCQKKPILCFCASNHGLPWHEEQHTLYESSGADHLMRRLYDAAGGGSSQSQGAHRHKLVVPHGRCKRPGG